MLFIKVYGYKEIPIGVAEFLIRCPSCETHSWADVMVLSKYFHFYFVPMWPIAKEANVICKKCGLKRYGIIFGPRLIDNFQEVKSSFKHPWFSYIGLAFLTLITLGVLVAEIINYN